MKNISSQNLDSNSDLGSFDNSYNIEKYLKTNNPIILEKLLIHNKNLVEKCVKTYRELIDSTPVLDLSDIQQVGMIGLYKAIQTFDPNKTSDFSSYANWWIKFSILREIITKANMIKIPIHISEKIMQIHKLENKSMHKYGYIDSNLICKKMNIDNDKYEFYKMLDLKFNKIKSLDSNDISLDFLDPDKIIDKKLFREYIIQSLDSLTREEKNVILLKFGFINNKIYTLKEISLICSISGEKIRQIEISAFKKLLNSSYVKTIHEQYTTA